MRIPPLGCRCPIKVFNGVQREVENGGGLLEGEARRKQQLCEVRVCQPPLRIPRLKVPNLAVVKCACVCMRVFVYACVCARVCVCVLSRRRAARHPSAESKVVLIMVPCNRLPSDAGQRREGSQAGGGIDSGREV